MEFEHVIKYFVVNLLYKMHGNLMGKINIMNVKRNMVKHDQMLNQQLLKVIRCISKDMCKGSDVKLQCLPNNPCNIECDSAGEENACEDTTIDGSLSTDLTVICHDKQSCLNSHINCGRGTCRVICISTDSTGANCEGLELNCGPSLCSIECDKGSNICTNVRINTLITTTSFECIAPGNNNPSCIYLNNNIAPFTRTTITPTINTLYPTYNPSISPSKSPTITPTI
eukprot:51529_1